MEIVFVLTSQSEFGKAANELLIKTAGSYLDASWLLKRSILIGLNEDVVFDKTLFPANWRN